MIGVKNAVNTSQLLSRCLAMVAMNPDAHGVLSDLLSVDGNHFDVQDFRGYLSGTETLPEELTFAQATAYVSRGAQQILIGWSEGYGHDRKWILNPKDKL